MVCNVSATLKWPKVGQHAISTLFLSLHHSSPLPLSFPSFTRHFKDTGFSFCRTRNINICTHHQHPSSMHHPLSCRMSLTLLEQDKGVLHAMLHSSDGCTTAMSTTEERQGHTGGHDQYIQKISLRFHNSFFFFVNHRSPPWKTPTCMCWFHQKNLKQLTVSPLRPHRCLSAFPPQTPRSPLRVSLPPSPHSL